jgi:hypothetical protein
LKIKIELICIFLALGLIFSACATTGPSGTTVTATGTEEGIVLSFDNLSKDTDRLFIMLQDATENNEILTFADIRSNDLEMIKNTGIFTCPYAQKGHVYKISVIPYSNDGASNNRVSVAAIANGGIYPSGNALFKDLDSSAFSEQYGLTDFPVQVETFYNINYENNWKVGFSY